jgi:hypothetical protein
MEFLKAIITRIETADPKSRIKIPTFFFSEYRRRNNNSDVVEQSWKKTIRAI